MRRMNQNNGAGRPQPIFAAFSSAGLIVVPQSVVIEGFEAQAATLGKQDVRAGPLFRGIADAFRNWCRYSEPGWMFQSPEANIAIIRIAATAPLITFATKEAIVNATAEQESVVDPPLRIAMP